MNEFEVQWQEFVKNSQGIITVDGKMLGGLTSDELKIIAEKFYGLGRSSGVETRTASIFERVFGGE